jgi:transcriptional regulator with XRE-family HTH domain
MPADQGQRAGAAGDAVAIDPYRSLLFPNHIRRLRKTLGYPKLLAMAERLPDIPYIRLSKIERGEVFAKPDELAAVAAVLGVAPADLLIDIDAPEFDIAQWAAELRDWEPVDPDKDRGAVLLAAAVRAVRVQDAGLTIAAIEQRFGIAPVILSRLENAFKPLDRWNGPTVAALCRMFGVRNVQALRKAVATMERKGLLEPYLGLIADPAIRIGKARARIADLRAALSRAPEPARARRTGGSQTAAPPPRPVEPVPSHVPDAPSADQAIVRLVPVFGAPLADGLIARTPTGAWVEAPRAAGPEAYGLRVCRPTLGLGLPASATVVVDPGRFPSSGGIAAVQDGDGVRLLAVTFDRQGRMMGYSESPSHEVVIDLLDPAQVATVISAVM